MAQTTTVLISRMILNTTGPRTSVVTLSKNQAIYTQGDPVGAVFYIQEGKVKLTVVSRFGKKAALGIFSEGDFFGEDGLAQRPLRLGSATATSDCKVLRIAEKAMAVALQKERDLSDLFIMQLLARHIRYQEALVDQFFDRTEIRLARVLLMLALLGNEGAVESVTTEVNEESLASMAGTSPPQVRSLMKHFTESGYLAYSKDGLQVRTSLLSFVLRG
jgi:CRP/FNR family transcriptional regulator, cyclic AMP receptor protein